MLPIIACCAGLCFSKILHHVEPKSLPFASCVQMFGFAWQLSDTQSQWQFLGKGYRAYKPSLHRFLSEDNISPFYGVNGYVFARHDPIMLFDPSGHFPVGAVLGFIPFWVMCIPW